MAVTRFGVSLDEELLLALDEYVEENNFSSRSRAIRHLIEKNLVEENGSATTLSPELFCSFSTMERPKFTKNHLKSNQSTAILYFQLRAFI